MIVVWLFFKVKVVVLLALLHIDWGLLGLLPESLQGRWYLLRPRTSTKVVIKLTLEVKVSPCQVFVTLFEVLLVVLWSRPAAKDTSVTWSASSPASVILISRSREITSVIALRSLKNCFCPKLEPISHLNAKIQKRGRQQNCV